MTCEYALTSPKPILVPTDRDLPAPPLHCVIHLIQEECRWPGIYYPNNLFMVSMQDDHILGPGSFCEDTGVRFAHIPSLTLEARFSMLFRVAFE